MPDEVSADFARKGGGAKTWHTVVPDKRGSER